MSVEKGSQAPKTPKNNPEEQTNNSSETPQKGVQQAPSQPIHPPTPPITLDLTPVDAEWVEEQAKEEKGQGDSTNSPDSPDSTAPAKTLPCSFFSCANGHLWPPEGGFVQCPGCRGPVITLRFRNCPVCNEPGIKWTLRVDRVPVGPGKQPLIAAKCRGQEGPAETQYVEFRMVEEQRPENKEIPDGQETGK